MYTEEQQAVLRQAAAILEVAHNDAIIPDSYMDGWRAGRAEYAAGEAARNIRTTLWAANKLAQTTADA